MKSTMKEDSHIISLSLSLLIIGLLVRPPLPDERLSLLNIYAMHIMTAHLIHARLSVRSFSGAGWQSRKSVNKAEIHIFDSF